VSELDVVVREADALRRSGTPFLLATVVDVRGSSYRRAGARMLVAEERWIAGCVSGGCLEGDVVRRGAFRVRHGAPVVVTYDSTSDDDIGWGFGLGCNGVVDLLLERIDHDAALDPLRFAGECIAAEARGALVTVFRSDDDAVPVGARLALGAGAPLATTMLPCPARDGLEAKARAALRRRDGSRGDGGRRDEAVAATSHGVTALIEVIEPPPRLFVCGTGHDAVPVVALARAMGWRITVAAAHPSIATKERFADADEVLPGRATALRAAMARSGHPLAVVMSHDYERDRACLAALLESRARYIGVLGPLRRTERILADLSRAGTAITDEALERLHAPVGLDLGAETPHEIALAIVAEVQATLTHAPGRRLRERRAPIHAAAHATRSAADRAPSHPSSHAPRHAAGLVLPAGQRAEAE
jgi:xanthine/CO dehydrogenase XdhC/CoxF family maturation factor